MLDRIKDIYNNLPRYITYPLVWTINLLIPILVFLINYNSDMTFVSSILGAILFVISLMAIIIIIFILIAWGWYIKDLLQAMKYNSVAKAFTEVNNSTSSFAQNLLNFFLSLIVAIVFCAVVISYSFLYIYETLLRLCNLL